MNDLHTIATGWLIQHARCLSRMTALEQCTAYLVESQEISEDTASRAAVQALAELESRNQTARIDTVATTAHVVIIHRRDGKPLAFTVNDLLRLHAMRMPRGVTQQVH